MTLPSCDGPALEGLILVGSVLWPVSSIQLVQPFRRLLSIILFF